MASAELKARAPSPAWSRWNIVGRPCEVEGCSARGEGDRQRKSSYVEQLLRRGRGRGTNGAGCFYRGDTHAKLTIAVKEDQSFFWQPLAPRTR
jgi:hypothetical protein